MTTSEGNSMFKWSRRGLQLALLTLSTAACAAEPKVTVREAAPPDVRTLGLPKNDAGALVVAASPQIELLVDPTMKNHARLPLLVDRLHAAKRQPARCLHGAVPSVQDAAPLGGGRST